MDFEKDEQLKETLAEAENTEIAEAEDGGEEYDLAGGEKAVQKQKLIRFLVAVAALMVCVFFFFADMEDDEEGYLIKIPTDEGYTWEVADFDETMVAMKGSGVVMEDGRSKVWFTGLAEGETEIHLVRYADGSSAAVEERTYQVKVLEDGTVLHRSITRNLMDN